MPTAGQIRTGVEKELGHRLSNLTWKHIDLGGAVDINEDLDEAVRYAVWYYRELQVGLSGDGQRSEAGMQERAKATRQRQVSRTEAVSAVLATLAAQEPAVIDFRERHLPALIPPRGVEDWISAHQLPKPSKKSEKALELISFQTSGDTAPRSVTIARPGVLAELLDVGNWLVAIYPWTPSQAATFVLTGSEPWVPPVTSTFIFRTPNTVRSRIVMEIDPMTPPEEVTQRYRAARKEAAGDRQLRGQGDRSYRLAAFRADHTDPDLTWTDLRTIWNRDYAQTNKDQYDSHRVSNFARDCRNAVSNLVGPSYQPDLRTP